MTLPPTKQVLEAALLAAGEPLSLERLRSLFPETGRPDPGELRGALAELAAEYQERAVELKEVASGYRIQVKPELAPWIAGLWEEKPGRYSRALLETLAIIAYRQPITRGEIEEIRGVSVSTSIMRTLQERDWVRVVGRREVPGRPALYGTTRGFLDYDQVGDRITATDIRLGIPGAHPFTFVLATRNGSGIEPTASFRTPRPDVNTEALGLLWSRMTGQTPVLCLASLSSPAPGQRC